MDDLDHRARQASQAMEGLNPQIQKLRDDLAGTQDFLSNDLMTTLRKSASSLQGGLESAENLQQMLMVLMKTALEGNSRVAAAQEQSLERVTQRANEDLAVFMTAMASAVTTSASLQGEIVSPREERRNGICELKGQ